MRCDVHRRFDIQVTQDNVAYAFDYQRTVGEFTIATNTDNGGIGWNTDLAAGFLVVKAGVGFATADINRSCYFNDFG
ncbi:hypothetical protein OS31_00910 [Dickeya oryzae]